MSEHVEGFRQKVMTSTQASFLCLRSDDAEMITADCQFEVIRALSELKPNALTPESNLFQKNLT